MSDADEYELDPSERLDDLEPAVQSLESLVADVKKTADDCATECEFMRKRISALEDEVKRLSKAVTEPAPRPK